MINSYIHRIYWDRILTVVITVPRRAVERARREAEKAGMTLEEYIIELLFQGLDPRDRAIEYIEAAQELLREAREEGFKAGCWEAMGCNGSNNKGICSSKRW